MIGRVLLYVWRVILFLLGKRRVERNTRKLLKENEERYPSNDYCKFSIFLSPLVVVDRIYFDLFYNEKKNPCPSLFKLGDSLLQEFDRADVSDEDSWGSKADILLTRQILERFCVEADCHPDLSTIGRILLKQIHLSFLQNRTRFIAYYNKNKELIKQKNKEHIPFEKPLIVTGLPRSGTTLLQRLLCEDPNTRYLHTYELEEMLPPLTAEADPLKDPRIQKSSAAMGLLKSIAPGFIEKFSESHLWGATEPEESLIYTQTQNGVSCMNGTIGGSAYLEMVGEGARVRSVLKYERRFLETLNAFRPPRIHWTLKAPSYAPYMQETFEEYPDARIVICHRDPRVTIPSVCKLGESWNLPFYEEGRFDRYAFGRLVKQYFIKACNVPVVFRRKTPDRAKDIFDVDYQRLFADPVGTVKSIYAHFGMVYTPEFEERMKIYLENNKQGKYGRHKYSLEMYGMNSENLTLDCKDYCDEFFNSPPPATK